MIRYIALADNVDSANICFDVWRLGYEKSTSVSFDQLITEGVDRRNLNRVVKKGTNAKRSTFGGCSLSHVPLEFLTNIEAKFQHNGERGVPYAFLNLIHAKKKQKDKLMVALGVSLCSLSDMCDPVSKVFKIRLQKVDGDLDWVTNQTNGK